MGLFFKKKDINEFLTIVQKTEGVVLLDVRTEEEYRSGHIPGSKNLPLQKIEGVESIYKDQSTPIFIYCLSGARSQQAVKKLKKMGYSQVENIGGICQYSGKLE